jgi:hypothetical protein
MSRRLVATIGLLVVVVFALSAFASAGPAMAGLKKASSFEGGTLYRAGKLRVAVLHGDYKKMGRQYGGLLGSQMKGMAATAELDFAMGLSEMGSKLTLKDLQDLASAQCGLYPKRLRDVLTGASETSGLSLKKIEFIDQVLLLTKVAGGRVSLAAGAASSYADSTDPDTGPQLKSCSSITAWGPYTAGGTTIMGREFDFPAFFLDFNRYLTLVVFNPTDGSEPTAIFSYAGSVGCIQSFNAAGLATEYNNGIEIPAPNNKVYPDRIPGNAFFTEAALDCADLRQLDAYFKTWRFNYPGICMVASPVKGRSYEVGTTDVIANTDVADGLQVIANTPVDPYWGTLPIHVPPDPRRDNLIALSNARKGSIDVKTMEQIFSVSVADGGAKEVGPITSDMTEYSIFQFVYVPASRVLVLSVPEVQDWTTIRLKGLFRSAH